jgi:hypothetical protein
MYCIERFKDSMNEFHVEKVNGVLAVILVFNYGKA